MAMMMMMMVVVVVVMTLPPRRCAHLRACKCEETSQTSMLLASWQVSWHSILEIVLSPGSRALFEANIAIFRDLPFAGLRTTVNPQ